MTEDELNDLIERERQAMSEEKPKNGPRKRLKGALAHLNIPISKEELDEFRREMWTNYPRERFFETEEKQ